MAVSAALSRGADVRGRDGRYRTTLWMALRPGVPNGAGVLDALLRAGAPADWEMEGGFTPLHHAASNGQLDVVRVLAYRGASIDAGDSAGMTPLMHAAHQRKVPVVQFLLERGADPGQISDNGSTAWSIAVDRQEPALIEEMLIGGADVNARDSAGRTVLLEILEHHARVMEGIRFEYEEHAAYYGERQVEPIVRMLLDYRADPNARDRQGRTPLMHAAAAGFAGIVQRLIRHGARVNEVDKRGGTALKLARAGRHREVIRQLKQAGATR